MLDRELFRSCIRLAALRVPAAACGPLVRACPSIFIERPSIKRVRGTGDGDETARLLLLHEALSRRVFDSSGFCGSTLDYFPPEARPILRQYRARIVPYNLMLSYSDYTMREVLRRILPSGMDCPTSFEAVGHIAHLNLDSEHEAYKKVIAEVCRVALLRTALARPLEGSRCCWTITRRSAPW